MKISLTTILLVLVTELAFSQSQFSDLRVIESSKSGMIVEFTPEYIADEIVSIDGKQYLIPQFRNAMAYNEPTGSTDLRYRSFMIAIPGNVPPTVNITTEETVSVPSIDIPPIPKIIFQDPNGSILREYSPTTSMRPEQIQRLSVSEVMEMRGWRFVRISVVPMVYDKARLALVKSTRMVLKIEFSDIITLTGDRDDEAARFGFINYSTAKQWMVMTGVKKRASSSSVLSTGLWYKMSIGTEGMYKIDGTYLRALGIDLSQIASFNDVKIFGSSGKIINENLAVSRPVDLPQVAVKYVDQNNNGKFEIEDYLIFYAAGTDGWEYSSVQKQSSHYVNPYTTLNYYFLAIGASNVPIKKMNISAFTETQGKIGVARGKVFFDEDKVNFILSGRNWVSSPFNPKDSRVVSHKLDGWINGTPVYYRYHLYGRSDVISSFSIDESGVPIKVEFISQKSSYDLNSPETTFANEVLGAVTYIPNLVDQRSNVKFTYEAASNVATGWIDWLEIFYSRSLSASNNLLTFSSPDSQGVVNYAIDGFTSNTVFGFDITDYANVKELSLQLDQLSGHFVFGDSLTSGALKNYWVGTADQFKKPASAVKIPNSNYHGVTGAQFVIITHHEFRNAAEKLKRHREQPSNGNPLSTIVIDIDTLYNEFGGGIPDPMSIRDFLSYAKNNWTIPPQYVLFFGDASYDFKNILNIDKNWVPTFQTSESNDKILSYAYDDIFSYLVPNSKSVSIAHGRICVRSSAEAEFMVDRIINYETQQQKSPWKNTVTFVADDEWTPESLEGSLHTGQADNIAQSAVPKSFELKKIYIGEYPTVFTSIGRRKPDARNDLLDQVNKYGTLLLNYTGHGNPKVWAHESILTYDDVKNQFQNNDKLTFIVAATCDWGRFEEAGEQSSAEEVMVNTSGGAIGVLSASRAVYSGDNFNTHKMFYQYLFSNSGGIRLGDAYLLMKNNVSSRLDNKQKYHLFGDPTMRLVVPMRTMAIDSINGISITSVDTLKAMQKVTITASVRDTNNAVDAGYNGSGLITVFDAEQQREIPSLGTFFYNRNGAIIYKGENTIRNGIMRTTFIVPKDISYENKNGRISVYFNDGAEDGRGYSTQFIVGGSTQLQTSDTQGPLITLYLDRDDFRSGDIVRNEPLLFVKLKDSSGINSSGASVGHRIEAWLDGGSKSIDLTELYKGTIDNFQEGNVEYTLSGLTPGTHTVKVRAWDVYNNSSVEEVMFVVSSTGELSIVNLYNFPNPASRSTNITFQHNQLQAIDIEVKVYSAAGRLIQTIERRAVMEKFVNIPWDLRDNDGDKLGNGVYFYKVRATTIDGKYTATSIGKLAVVD